MPFGSASVRTAAVCSSAVGSIAIFLDYFLSAWIGTNGIGGRVW
jgi:hypothetical protein